MFTCYIGIGSNLGDRQKNIHLAIERMNKLKATKITRISSIIETRPVGGPLQDDYLNLAVELQTDFTPRELLNNLQNIEAQLGRKRLLKNGPRTIDLDILLFDKARVSEDGLSIPHPRLLERDFVLRPLKEIAPQALKDLINETGFKD